MGSRQRAEPGKGPVPVLVLGASGRIGAILRQCWAGQVRAGRITWQARTPGAGDWTLFDPLADPAALGRAARDKAVILCLAGVTPGRAAADPGAAMADNLRLARAALRAGAETGAAVLLASSAAVYGDRTGPCTEDTAPAPVSEYGRAKAAAEAEAAVWAKRDGLRVCTVRIGNIAGLDAALGGWRPGFRLDRFADGATPMRSYVGPLTLARLLAGLVDLTGRGVALPAVLNLAAPGAVGMGALLDAAGLDWTPRPAEPGAIARVELDVARLARLLPLDADAGTPERLVAEWRMLRDRDGNGT